MPINFKFSYQVGSVKKVLSACALIMLASFTMSAYSASKTILVLGDSLSAEYGLQRGEGWVSLLQKKLDAEKITAPIVNASISGETTSGGAARLPALLAKHQPAVLVIELGANDALRGLSLVATQQNLRAMVTAAQKAKAKVLLVGMQIPPNYGTDYTRQFAALFPKIAKDSKSALVPFMLKDVADKADPNLFQADRIHPAAVAHPIILNNIWPQLKPLLAK
ncbi:Esterase TesA precursor [compost metagenome]